VKNYFTIIGIILPVMHKTNLKNGAFKINRQNNARQVSDTCGG
jgi:hypothetical protein